MISLKKAILGFVSFLLIFFSVFLLYSAPLLVDEVFKLNVERVSSGKIKAQWGIAKGYHLYKKEMSILLGNNNGTILGKIVYPQGIKEHSNVLGDYDIYKDKVIVDIPVLQWGNGNTELIFRYQGCKDFSSCYPPVSKVVSISPPPVAVNYFLIPTVSSARELLEGGNIIIILVSFFVFGILLSMTPCVFPMIPILIGIIMGQKEVKTFKAFILSLIYVLGVAVTYTIAGVITAMLGNSIQSILQNFWVIFACSIIFVLLSLSLFGLYELQLPSSVMNKLNNISGKTKGGSYIGVFLMGAISSLVVSPCVSAPLAGALLYIASTGNLFLGGSALFSLSLGMGVLLVIAGVTGGKLFLKTGSWMIAVRYFLGVCMLAVAIWLLSRIVPKVVTDFLWAILLIGVGFYMGALESVKEGSTWIKFKKIIAFLIMLFGITIFLRVFLIEQITPITGITHEKIIAKTFSSLVEKDNIFNVVTTPEELQKLIDIAVKEQKPVMIDYYAEWCVSCKEMDGTTFSDPNVRYLLKSFVIIRADITKNDANSEALKKKYRVFAPPYIVFLDKKGKEIKQAAIAGEVSPKQLLEQMNNIISSY